MDKFGIFNFLNAFSDYVNKNGKENSDNKSGDNQDVFSKLLSGLTGKSVNAEGANKNAPTDGFSNLPENTQKKGDDLKKPSPLNTEMLSAMHSHDEFIKRIKAHNKK